MVISKDKFQFCQDTIDFAGFKVTPTGIAPSDSTLKAIKDFPTPSDITGIRSWFGIINQVAWSYAVSPALQPFRDLCKTKTKFTWDSKLDSLFQQSKTEIINLVHNGIRSFDPKLPTCLQCDWSKKGIGFLLLQKHCTCSMENLPNCCNEGWKLVFAGSRFTLPAESRYAPVEGEALSAAWALRKARMFVPGCNNLTVVTDHKPLLGILNNRDLGTIANPRIQRIKALTLPYCFTLKYCPGKWNRGADAVSRYPTVTFLTDIPSDEQDYRLAALCEDDVQANASHTLVSISSHASLSHLTDRVLNVSARPSTVPPAITLDRLTSHCLSDPIYCSLLQLVKTGFPKSLKDLDPLLRPFKDKAYEGHLSLFGDIVLMDKQLVIPKALRALVMQTLHSAHQGCTGMTARARTCVYWPGMHKDILNYRANCHSCSEHAPSQPKEPLILSPEPSRPYEKICADYYQMGLHHYLAVVDRFSGFLHIFKCPSNPDSASLISALRSLFSHYGSPSELSSDGGPQFKSHAFEKFLLKWGVHHRQSSAYYAQSNGRAELGVKTAKRILRGNVGPDGSIDNDAVARAVLQHHNTPLPDCQLSPAQLLFGNPLKDFLPAHPSYYTLHPKWLELRHYHSTNIRKRTENVRKHYDSTAHNLKPLTTGQQVFVQNKTKRSYNLWNQTGMVTQVLPHRQYKVKIHSTGNTTLRNRRFLKPVPQTYRYNNANTPFSS